MIKKYAQVLSSVVVNKILVDSSLTSTFSAGYDALVDLTGVSPEPNIKDTWDGMNFADATTEDVGVRRSIVEVTSNYTITADDRIIIANSGSPFNVTLMADPNGVLLTIKNIGAGTVTVVGTIDGGSNATLSQDDSISLVSYDGEWGIW